MHETNIPPEQPQYPQSKDHFYDWTQDAAVRQDFAGEPSQGQLDSEHPVPETINGAPVPPKPNYAPTAHLADFGRVADLRRNQEDLFAPTVEEPARAPRTPLSDEEKLQGALRAQGVLPPEEMPKTPDRPLPDEVREERNRLANIMVDTKTGQLDLSTAESGEWIDEARLPKGEFINQIIAMTKAQGLQAETTTEGLVIANGKGEKRVMPFGDENGIAASNSEFLTFARNAAQELQTKPSGASRLWNAARERLANLRQQKSTQEEAPAAPEPEIMEPEDLQSIPVGVRRRKATAFALAACLAGASLFSVSEAMDGNVSAKDHGVQAESPHASDQALGNDGVETPSKITEPPQTSPDTSRDLDKPVTDTTVNETTGDKITVVKNDGKVVSVAITMGEHSPRGPWAIAEEALQAMGHENPSAEDIADANPWMKDTQTQEAAKRLQNATVVYVSHNGNPSPIAYTDVA